MAVTGKLQHLGVKFKDGGAVANADQGHIGSDQLPIQAVFVGGIQSASRFVQNGKEWSVEQQTGKCKTLLLADGEYFVPIHFNIQAAEATRDVRQVYLLQQVQKLVIAG